METNKFAHAAPDVIKLRDPDDSTFNQHERIYRDGIELDKGTVITEQWLQKNEELLYDCWNIYTVYPDIYLDLIKPVDSNFNLFPYQRMFLRVCMRYTHIYITAARATSKTFLSILAKYLQCVFLPGHVGSIVAPNKSQAAKITKQKVQEIWRIWPLLKNELELYNGEPHANFGKDYTELYFKNGSKLSVVCALDSDRGIRTHATLIDEARDQDGDAIAEIILPQMNVSRRTANGLVNNKEAINTQVIYATSAGMKSSFAYEALLDYFEESILDPSRAFTMGLDYRIPMMHGLIDAAHVKNLKMSPSYNEQTFASEYMGTWLGGSEESWFDFEKISKYRKIKNPEWSQKFRGDTNIFYLISVDVGRLSDQTVACIWRINIRDNKYYSTLVNIFVLGRQAETKTFVQQSIDLKRLIEQFNPREVVIDCNGLGIGLADEMIRTQTDEIGNTYPAYGFFNNEDYKKIQPKDAACILYSMKANGPLNSKIHSNAYTRLNSGMIRFLITEQEARSALLATKVGAKMSFEKRVKRLMPHELTTKLFEEMANLRLKRSGMDIVLEQINSRFPKDKYSAFAYGQWRIKELEEEAYQKQKRRSIIGGRKLVFFSGGV
jgi:hypothetical protein